MVILIAVACSDKKMNPLSEKIAGIDKPLNEVEMRLLKDLQKEYIGYFTSRSENVDEPFKTLIEMDSFEFSVCPAYELDIDRFYMNPSAEMLLACLSPLKNQIWFAGKQANGKSVRLDFLKEGERWRLSGSINDFGKVVSWLPMALAKADSRRYMEFNVFGHEYVVYLKNGKPIYHRITGDEISADRLCEYIMESINVTQENLKFRKEHPEFFKKMVL